MAKQLLEGGQIITVKGEKFEVMHISAQEDENGKPQGFKYELWHADDADALRKANAAEQQRLDDEKRAKEKANEVPATYNQEDSQSE